MLQTISTHYPQISAAVQFNGKNIFGTPKMQNIFWYPIKMLNFPILQQQCWNFLYCSPFSYRYSNLTSLHNFFVSVLQIGSWLLLDIASNIVIALKVKSTEKSSRRARQSTTIAIAIVRRAITLGRVIKKMYFTKNEAKKIKSNNLTWSNREKSNIAIAMLEKLIIVQHHNYFTFWEHQ